MLVTRKKVIFPITLLLFILTSLSFTYDLKPNIDFIGLDDHLQFRLQEIMDAQPLVADDEGGISASIITSCDEVYDVFTGNAKEGVPIDGSTLMGLSDVSQTVLATIALKLDAIQTLDILPIEFSIEQSISEYLEVSALPNISGDITIEQLLRHTSGLDDFADHPDYQSTLSMDPERVFTPEEVIELFVDEPTTAGEFSYARTNYLLLSLIIEEVLAPFNLQQGLDFFLSTAGIPGLTIFDPANELDGCSTLFADSDGTGSSPLASLNAVMTGTGGAADILGTPSDIVRLIAIIQDSIDSQTFISREEAELLNDFMPVEGRIADEFGIGIELFNLEINGETLPFVGHLGSINYKSVLLYNQERQIGIFLSTNNTNVSEEEALELARQLLEETFNDEDCTPQTEPLSLQFLHASDLEGGVEALDNAPNFAAIVEGLEATNMNTIVLSSGDNYIPGPFFNAAGDFSLREVIQEVHQDFFDEPGLTNLRETPGRIDISIMNFIGFDASAVGNHEFDAGPDAYADIIGTDIRGENLSDVRWLGAQFPYLSSNYDFSQEGALSGLATSDRFLLNTEFQSLPSDLESAGAAPKIAPSTIIERGGQRIGVIGATTQVLQTISSTGDLESLTPGGDDMAALAAIIQPIVDEFEADGINKIVVVSHLQQISLEKELATLLDGVDLIFAGGSDVLQAQDDDILRPGDVAQEGYPFLTTDLDGNPVAVVGTPGEYTYVGRLIVEFDENGVIEVESLENSLNGVYPSLDEVVTEVAGDDPFALGTNAELVQRLTNAIRDLVNAQDGNILGRTSVFIEGRREAVRTEETNMGNLTADANLILAQSFDETVEVSIKNGGGIRAAIGQVIDLGDGTSQLAPPPANPSVGKEVGDISQLDVVNTLRFNNGLSLLTLTIPEFKEVLEYGFAATSPGNTPGRFPQVGGISVTVDTSMAEGDQIIDLFLIDANGDPTDQLIDGGQIIADEDRTIRIVTLDFLADGGDGYPYPELSNPDRVDLEEVLTEPGMAAFADPGTEQDALAEFLIANTLDDPFDDEETPADQDGRIIFTTSDISNEAPNAIFIADPTEGMVPLEVSFDAVASSDSDGMIVSYDWDFGDGNTGTGVMTTHTYAQAGNYTVVLTVTDDDGAIATSSQLIVVEGAVETGTARIQLIHNADSETVEVLVNGEVLVPEFAYRTATPYVEVPAGVALEISLVPVNPFSSFPEPVNTTLTLNRELSYVAVAYGTFDDFDDFPVEFALFEGAVEDVGDQEVALQFFHGSNDAGDVDIVLEDGAILFDDVSYGAFGNEYLVVPADRYNFSVTPANDNASPVANYSAGFSFWKRRSAVIFATELLGDGTFKPWVALSNGGTYPLNPVNGLLQPEIYTQGLEGLGGDVRIAPNPVYDFTQVSFEIEDASDVNITLYSIQGKLLQNYSYTNLGKGEYNVAVDLSGLQPGTYYMQLKAKDLSKTKSIVIAR